MQWNNCRRYFLWILLCLVFVSGEGVGAAASDLPQPVRASEELGTWVWQSSYIQDAAERDQLFRFCKLKGIDLLLLQIPFLGDSDQIEAPAELGEFLEDAAHAGIKVEALDGEAHMGLADRRARTLRRLDAVLAFHNAQPPGQGFAGLHYDIEPYLNERWKAGDLQQVILESLETMADIRQDARQAAPGLTIAYDIPAWYEKRGDALTVTFNGQRKNFQEHIQDLSDYVGVMSYRRHVTGPNSLVALSATVIAYAEKTGKQVYLSLETVPLKDSPNITFSGTSPELLFEAVGEVRRALQDSPAFRGVLIHDYRHLRVLVETAAAQPVSAAQP